MTARRPLRLAPRRVAKPWGRTDIGPLFDAGGERTGEIWFEVPDATGDGDDPALLIKYLFTSEKLSVQVHPNDTQARAMGAAQGKEEAWVIVSADPGATLGLGLRQTLSPDALADAARDGSIEDLMDWRSVAPGDHFHVTPGTIHAIGGGLVLVEVQQYADITYRLYDYGRPRELHLDAAIACAVAAPYTGLNQRTSIIPGAEMLVDGDKFALMRLDSIALPGGNLMAAVPLLPPGQTCWFIPLTGRGTLAGERWAAGECWMGAGSALDLAGMGTALVAWAVS